MIEARGDATYPAADGPVIVAHIVNDIGAWGSGFVLAVSKRWPQPQQAYRVWVAELQSSRGRLPLGEVQLVNVDESIWVANMVAQSGIRPVNGRPPIRYEALSRCLNTVAEHAQRLGASVHMPRIGTARAGGTWDEIAPRIEQAFERRRVPVVVYQYEPTRSVIPKVSG